MILLFLLIVAVCKWFCYYCALRGLLHYYGTIFNHMPEVEAMKEITNQAMKRVISDFFKLHI